MCNTKKILAGVIIKIKVHFQAMIKRNYDEWIKYDDQKLEYDIKRVSNCSDEICRTWQGENYYLIGVIYISNKLTGSIERKISSDNYERKHILKENIEDNNDLFEWY